MSGPFDYIRSINDGKAIPLDDDYSQFLTNMAFSLSPDTLFIANELNCGEMSNRMHYQYCLATVRPRKRFPKWPKRVDRESGDLALIMQIYKYNVQRSKEVLDVLSKDQISALRDQYT
jgi:hypothetical protein